MAFWLVKEEPTSFSWEQFVAEGRTAWTGVRNHQARNNLRRMRPGDWVLYYHSGRRPEVVGLARVAGEPHPDPTASKGDWVAVDLEPVRPLPRAVPLAVLNADPALAGLAILRQPRLSVAPVTSAQFRRILELAGESPTGVRPETGLSPGAERLE
ncbi:MAG: EVE domain-containing protein [Verrucomicrobia bacterium]|nr:MAG: EVE domain-containing protein [Verrucomicrobiota bacterium]